MPDHRHPWLLRAREAVAATELLEANGYHDFAAEPAYYAMLYVAWAFCDDAGLARSKNPEIVAMFLQTLARDGRVPEHWPLWLREAAALRRKVERARTYIVDSGAAMTQIARAEEFLRFAHELPGESPEDAPEGDSDT